MHKRNVHRSWITGFIVLLICSFFAFSSCKKTGDTIAVITVKDATGNPVGGASVTLWQDTSVNTTTGSHSNVRVTQTAGSNGVAQFTFALEAYLNITATQDTNVAHGFVRLQEHETVNQTVHF